MKYRIQSRLAAPLRYINGIINNGHARSIRAKKNILASILIKGCSIAISLVLVPLTIGYINPARYGIWLTMSSIVGWLSFFDIGFTQGLRNKFAEAKAKNDTSLVRTYISTTYFYVGLIFLVIFIAGFCINYFISWHSILNVPADMENEISKLAIIILCYFCLQFIFRIINTILIADQKPARASLLDLFGQFLSLAIIFLLTRFTNGSLINLGFAIAVPVIIVLIAANLFLFKTAYKEYAPAPGLVKKEFARDIIQLGAKFFVLQIASIIQYESILFLIAHYFDTTQVTAYNIAYKYFFTLQMGFAILLSPLWSGVTDAYNSGDMQWIRNVVKKYLRILILFILAGGLMLLFANNVYALWLGKNNIYIKYSISVLCYIFFSTAMFASIFVNVINGTGALRVQFISSILTCIGFFCLSLLLIKKFHFGIEAILVSSIISNVYGYIIAPLQYYHIFVWKSKNRLWYT